MTDGGLARTLEAVTSFVGRFVVLTEHQLVAAALFVFHTHAFDAADATPYLSVSSAEKRSGKTRLLEVLELLVRAPLPTMNISDAALFRSIEKMNGPTLLLDEIDAVFGPRARDREDLRGMLNAGYRRGAVARRMGGANNTTLQEFQVFAPKVFAGIGELPDTIRDRAIRVRLERRTREEPIDRFRRRDAEPAAEPIRESLASIAEFNLDRLADARPALPDELDDRAQDVWEPLLAIADLAGDPWPQRARAAALALSTGQEREDESPGARLLQDLFAIFTDGEQRYRTSDLLDALAEIEESPWGAWYGKPLTAHGLSKLLKPYGIRTMPVWADGQTVKGYKSEQFADAWLRVLGVRRVSEVRSGSSIEAAPNPPNRPNPARAEQERQGEQAQRDTERWESLEHALLDKEYIGALVRDGVLVEGFEVSTIELPDTVDEFGA
jgi:hypothetical protein